MIEWSDINREHTKTAYQETILIADGEPLGRETLKALLMSQGYNLTFATNGPDTLTSVKSIQPDLLLLDAMMPGIDGFEICKRLRSEKDVAEVPIIMVTSLDDDAARLRGLEVGVDDFITKPFDMAQLRARVRTITKLSRQRRLRTQELQEERDRNQAILEALGEAVIVTDINGIIKYINPAATLLTGFTRDESIERDWRLLQDEDTGLILGDVLDKVKTGKTWRGEIVSRHKSGDLIDVALTVAPLFVSKDPKEPIGFVSVQRDITPLKTAERAKDEFVSNVSHELRTPLSVITLIGDNLDSLYARLDDEKRRKMVRDIQQHSQTLNDLINDVLELSRIDSNRISTARVRLNFAELAREETEKLQPLAWEKTQVLDIESPDELMILGNKGQLQQVIRNLLNNAIKYTDYGGKIMCRCQTLVKNNKLANDGWPGLDHLSVGTWAALQVTDNGIGISEEHLPFLFERFYRVKSQQKIRGTGLGLAITSELIRLHGGKIAVDSKPDQGSTFAFYLPIEEI
ncbi:MAG: response regulator [Anaerolineae bacterium]|nr:response regulator [Anaerolineae bacterium]